MNFEIDWGKGKMKSFPSWKAWIFDLDDTLLDTSNILIPTAFKKVCTYLVSKNILLTADQGLKFWQKLNSQYSTLEIIEMLVQDSEVKLDSEQMVIMVNEAYKVFRTPDVPAQLELMSGGAEVLESLQLHEAEKSGHDYNSFLLFLVTQGEVQTQMKKVQSLKIAHFFKSIYYVDPYSGETKLQALQDILLKNNLNPAQVLSIGNRLDNEIAFAKKLGMMTCFFAYGEHAHFIPQLPEQIPDFKINHLSELKNFLSREK